MNREIKFRGKRIDNGEWVYGDLLNHPDGTKRIISLEQIGNNTELVKEVEHNNEVIPETVGQFTGRTDKEGNDLYEGDVCEIRYKDSVLKTVTGVVEWHERHCHFSLSAGETYSLSMGGSIVDGIYKIGNIFDNPEYLQK